MLLVRRDVALIETDAPWAFRPGDLFRAGHTDFEITRVTCREGIWLRVSRKATRYLVRGVPLRDDAPRG